MTAKLCLARDCTPLTSQSVSSYMLTIYGSNTHNPLTSKMKIYIRAFMVQKSYINLNLLQASTVLFILYILNIRMEERIAAKKKKTFEMIVVCVLNISSKSIGIYIMENILKTDTHTGRQGQQQKHCLFTLTFCYQVRFSVYSRYFH